MNSFDTLNATISMLIRDQINILFAGFSISRKRRAHEHEGNSFNMPIHTAYTQMSICMQNVKDTLRCASNSDSSESINASIRYKMHATDYAEYN